MSILQEYEECRKRLGEEEWTKMQGFLRDNEQYLLSDLLYKEEVWTIYEEWKDTSMSIADLFPERLTFKKSGAVLEYAQNSLHIASDDTHDNKEGMYYKLTSIDGKTPSQEDREWLNRIKAYPNAEIDVYLDGFVGCQKNGKLEKYGHLNDVFGKEDFEEKEVVSDIRKRDIER